MFLFPFLDCKAAHTTGLITRLPSRTAHTEFELQSLPTRSFSLSEYKGLLCLMILPKLKKSEQLFWIICTNRKCRLLKSSSLFDEHEDFVDSVLINIRDIMRTI